MSEEENEKPSLKVTLERTGRVITHIESYSLDSDYTVSTDGFEFTAYAEGEARKDLFGLELEPVHLEIDGASQVLGRIESSGSGTGLSRSFRGRDYLADLVENHIDPTIKVKQGDKLGNVIKLAASPCGIAHVKTEGELVMRDIRAGKALGSAPLPLNLVDLELGEYKANAGEGTYEFLARICARNGATIQPADARYSLLLDAPNYGQTPSYTFIRSLDGRGNNITSGEASRDFSSFPTLFIATGKGGSAAEPRTSLAATYRMSILASEFNSELAVIMDRHVQDERLAPGAYGHPFKLYRLHVYNDEQARNTFQLERSSRRRLSELLRNTLTYSCTVKGHRDRRSGALYAVNTIAHVRDEKENVDEPLWVYKRTFSFDRNGGKRTTLGLWRPATFII